MKTTKKAFFLILLSSLVAGIGQLLWKQASFSLSLNLLSILNPYLIIGTGLYILAIILMTLSFREGELSVLYPFLTINYIWVTFISAAIFKTESLSLLKIIGIFSIFIGVTLIGIGGKKANAD